MTTREAVIYAVGMALVLGGACLVTITWWGNAVMALGLSMMLDTIWTSRRHRRHAR